MNSNSNSNNNNDNNIDSLTNSNNSNLKTFLNEDYLLSMKIQRSFPNQFNKKFSSLNFDDNGEFLLTTGEDHNLNVFNCLSGSLDITQGSKKYGCNLGRFTHYSKNILFASTMENDTVRYLSLEESKFIAYFIGHTNKVVSLEMAPFDDHFLTSSLDKTIRLWDLRSPHCQAFLNNPNPHYITFDPKGRIFATLEPITSSIHLYDLRSLGRGPFTTFPITYPNNSVHNLSGIKFSPDSKKVLISGDSGYNILLDSYSGKCHNLMRTVTEETSGNFGENTTFTPDGRYIIGCGSDSDGGILEGFNIDHLNNSNYNGHASENSTNLKPNLKWRIGSIDDIPRAVRFNHRRFQMVSGGNEINFWLPDIDLIAKQQQHPVD